MVELRPFEMHADWQFLDELVANDEDDFYSMDATFRSALAGEWGCS